jgi:AcrR family transcriptional regulator
MNSTLSNRQSEIIHTAIKLIGEGGIQALTIKNLSAEIGIAESAIYRHFKSKTEVLSTLLDYLTSIIISHYNHTYRLNGSSIERIKEMIIGQLKIFAENPSYAIVILSDGLYKNERTLHNKIFELMENAKSTYIKIIDEGKCSGEVRNDVTSEQIAFIIMGGVRLTINQWSLSNFSFNLKESGNILFNTMVTLIQKSK